MFELIVTALLQIATNENNGDVNIEELAKDVASGKTYREFPGCYYFADRVGTLKVILHFTAHPVYNQNLNYLEYRQQQDGTDWETILREYDLRFVDSTVAVFTSDLVRKNAIGEYEESRDEDAVYFAGLDTATTGNDYCTLPILKYKMVNTLWCISTESVTKQANITSTKLAKY